MYFCNFKICQIFQKRKINIVNLGTNEYSNVRNSVKIICKILKAKPKLIFTGGKEVGLEIALFIFLDTKKIRSTGWRPKYSINKSIEITTKYLLNNPWLMKRN